MMSELAYEKAAHSGGKLVRYCFECGRIGHPPAPYIACCPDNRSDIIREEVAQQAKAGFKALYGEQQP
jgi:uncharacterized OB-fold protein